MLTRDVRRKAEQQRRAFGENVRHQFGGPEPTNYRMHERIHRDRLEAAAQGGMEPSGIPQRHQFGGHEPDNLPFQRQIRQATLEALALEREAQRQAKNVAPAEEDDDKESRQGQ